jgi:ferritin-like metal-binding protein YciE
MKAAHANRKSQPEMQKSTDSKLRDFFVDGLKDIYWAEKAMLKALPKMKEAATSEELKAAFEDHMGVTETQVGRLEQVFELMGEEVKGEKCEAMAGIIKEGEDIIGETEEGTATRDVGLIMAAQKVEHYEISTYGGLAQLARTLGESEAAQLLEDTLAEEKETDVALTEIAENDINYEAGQED